MMAAPRPPIRMASGPLASPGLSASFDNTSLVAIISTLEEELRQISAELAASIKREMDLEDTVDQMQMDPTFANRRTSDYFSDEGTTSIRIPPESESRQDALDKIQRRMEQEKAQVRLDYNNKIQDERRRRKSLEFHIGELEDRASRRDDPSEPDSTSGNRIRELEGALDDSRRRAAEERQAKENYEDLLSALRLEVDNHRNERDNLRDEVIPQLRARIEGLESEATNSHKLTYENTRLSQQIQTLKRSPSTIDTAVSHQQQQQRIDSIAEEPSPAILQRRSVNGISPLTRSNSMRGLARSGSVKEHRDHSRGGDMNSPGTGTGTGMGMGTGGGAGASERIQDIKAQRDALHKALKSLLDRQEMHAKLAAKTIRRLEYERDQALRGVRVVPKGGRRGPVRLDSEDQWLRRRAEEEEGLRMGLGGEGRKGGRVVVGGLET